ncbi:hypothetical protein C0Q88_12095 [Ralstonia pickettii]|uniref:Disease resistance R13L4/SHOC-2-like LRR domain-containing protein n=1 Tax=Ralstonia pickettii TaxID=329 RepID=A0A2N4TSS9_RALPI|nr:leucine-rich repeat domain-containing protein [Ralstonia pickettii]PLC42679.1 hypothetical protein C0Q88_12095 [Ralstonia pickettii]
MPSINPFRRASHAPAPDATPPRGGVPAYATPARQAPAQQPRRRGLAGLFGLRRASAHAGEAPAARPNIAASTRPGTARTAPNSPLHGLAAAPDSPLQGAAALHARIAGSGVRQALEQWHTQMLAQIADYRPANPPPGFSAARQLNTARDHIEDVARGRQESANEIRLMTTPVLRLPDIVSEIAHLKALHLSDCDLRELPHDLGNLGMLETLKLRNNASLHTLPDTLGQLRQMKHLEIVGSGVRELPSMHGLVSLEHLAIERSPLTWVPRDIGNAQKLKTLSLAHTYLRDVPASIGNLTKLTELKLDNNPGLTSIPDSIGKLRRLKKLDLSHCPQLRTVPASIGNLRDITIDLRGCTGLTMQGLPKSLITPIPGRKVHFPEHLSNDIGKARGEWAMKHDPRLQLLHADIERKNDEMENAVFGSGSGMNDAQLVSVAFRLKDAHERLPEIRNQAVRNPLAPQANESAAMRQALAEAFNMEPDPEVSKRLRTAARALPRTLQHELADLVASSAGRQLVIAIGESAFGVRGNSRLQQRLPALAHSIASHPQIKNLRDQARRFPSANPSHEVAAQLTPLVQHLWNATHAQATLDALPASLQTELKPLLASEAGRQLVLDLSKVADGAKGSSALRRLLPQLATRLAQDPQTKALHRLVRADQSATPEERSEGLAVALLPIAQQHWNALQRENTAGPSEHR